LYFEPSRLLIVDPCSPSCCCPNRSRRHGTRHGKDGAQAPAFLGMGRDYRDDGGEVNRVVGDTTINRTLSSPQIVGRTRTTTDDCRQPSAAHRDGRTVSARVRRSPVPGQRRLPPSAQRRPAARARTGIPYSLPAIGRANLVRMTRRSISAVAIPREFGPSSGRRKRERRPVRCGALRLSTAEEIRCHLSRCHWRASSIFRAKDRFNCPG
jgi:hypothetical protein